MDLKKKRWFILAASLLINLCIGSGYAWSVFAGPLIAEFGWTATATALTFTIANAVSPITMISGGKIQDVFGPKWVILVGGVMFGLGIFLSGTVTTVTGLYLTYGILAGLGMGLIYSCTIANTVKFFPDKRGLVSGLATAGYGAGAVVFAPIAATIIASEGVLPTFKTLGIVFGVIIVVCSFFIKTAPVGYKPEGWEPPVVAGSAPVNVDKTWSQMLKDPTYYILLAILTIGATAGLMIISQASPIAQEVVLTTPATAALIVSAVGVSNMLGRILWGFISDKIGRYKALPIIYALLGVSMFLLTTVGAGDIVVFVACVVVIGSCFGGFMGVFPALTADSFGAKNNGVNYGFMFIGFAIGGYVGPVLAANIKTANAGDYSIAFLISAGLCVVGILLVALAANMKKKKAALQQ